MKIQNNFLKDFISKKCSYGDHVCLLMKEDGIHMDSMSFEMTKFTSAILDVKAIEEYKVIEEKIGIVNTERLDRIIGLLPVNGKTEIKINNSVIEIITATEKHIIPLIASESIVEMPEINLNYTDGAVFEISIDNLKRMIANIKTIEEKNGAVINFNISGNNLTYYSKKDNEEIYGLPIPIKPVISNTVNVSFNSVNVNDFVRIINSKVINVSMKTDFPITIKENIGQFMKVSYVLAPYIDEEGTPISSDEETDEVEENVDQ